MSASPPTCFLLASLLVLTSGCGSSDKREFQQALNLDERVAEEFAKFIASQGHAAGKVIVVTHPDVGPRIQESQTRRLRGFRKGFGDANVVEVPVAAPRDDRLVMVQNDYVPSGLLREAVAAHPGATAVISLVGFPHEDPVGPFPVPLYLFGLSHQQVAQQALDGGWALAALYSRGASDTPPRKPAPISPEVLDSYTLEVR